MKPLVLQVIAALAVLLGVSSVEASPASPATTANAKPGSNHRWVLQDAGANCRRVSSPANLLVYGDSIVNDQGKNVDVVCPVSLGGQFDGFEPASGKQAVFHHATVPVARATISVLNSNPKQSVSCSAVATASNGTTWASRTVSVPGSAARVQKLDLAPQGNWGGQLGTALKQFPIRSLSYHCTLPPGTVIQRYVTAVCQNNAECSGADMLAHGVPSALARTQHNAGECVLHQSNSSTLAASVLTSESGIRLSPGVEASSFVQVVCPLTTVTGDSQMGPGTFRRIDVFMTLPPTPVTGLSCKVVTLDDRNTEADFIGPEEFKFDAGKGVWTWAGRRKSVRRGTDEGWASTYLNCFLVPGTGIAGVVTTQEVGPRWPVTTTPPPRAPVQPPTVDEAAW